MILGKVVLDKKITPEGYFFDFILRRRQIFYWW